MGRYVAFSADYESHDTYVTLDPEESYHLAKVLRVRPGDSVQLLNGRGLIGQGVVRDIDARKVGLTIQRYDLREQPRPNLELALGLPKPKALEQILKQATELGVSSIHLLHCEHTAYILEPKEHKWERLEVILMEACKQSLNPFLPKLYPPVPFKAYLEELKHKTHTLMLVASLEAEAAPLKAHDVGQAESIRCFVGPEGDFSAREYASLKDLGALSLCLGTNILRVETAVVTLLAQLRGAFA